MTGTGPRRRSRIRDGCATLALCLVVVAAVVWVIVRTVVMWIAGHPGAVAILVAFAIGGGVAGTWIQVRQDRDRGE